MRGRLPNTFGGRHTTKAVRVEPSWPGRAVPVVNQSPRQPTARTMELPDADSDMMRILRAWWIYGAEGPERATRVFIAALDIGAISLLINSFYRDRSYLPAWLLYDLAGIHEHVNLEKLSGALGITTAVLAGACATFIGSIAQHTLEIRPTRADVLAPRVLMCLVVAFLSALIATLTFGTLVAVSPANTSGLHWSVMLAAVVQLLSSALFVIFAMALIVPNLPAARMADSLITALSYMWPVLYGLLGVLAIATPGLELPMERVMLLSVSIVMSQIFIAHGWVRMSRGTQRYMGWLEGRQRAANRWAMSSVVITAGFLLSVLIRREYSDWIVMLGVCLLAISWSLAVLHLQVWVEGTRKAARYAGTRGTLSGRHETPAARRGILRWPEPGRGRSGSLDPWRRSRRG